MASGGDNQPQLIRKRSSLKFSDSTITLQVTGQFSSIDANNKDSATRPPKRVASLSSLDQVAADGGSDDRGAAPGTADFDGGALRHTDRMDSFGNPIPVGAKTPKGSRKKHPKTRNPKPKTVNPKP